MAAIEIGNDRTVPINERRARVDGVLISLETEGMDDLWTIALIYIQKHKVKTWEG